MRDELQDELERLLVEGLATYSVEEPGAGLEGRILGRIRSESGRQRFTLPRWVIAIPAMAALLVAAAVHWGHRTRPEAPRQAVRAPMQARQEPALAAQQTARPVRGRAAIYRARARLPRLRQFPAPAALTGEERALLMLARDSVLAPGKPGIDPIQIEQIRIEPLHMDGSQ